MPQITIVFGVALCLIGVGFYVGTGTSSLTALIPTFIGLPVLLAGLLALKEGLRKHAMHAAVLLGLLALVGSLRGAVQLPALLGGGPVARPAAVLAQSITAALSLVFVALCVRSFVVARRSRS